ncbi:hypothetical protein COL940_006727 [Colletotrichum noveboracense]|nr:hypothetical protein COL940_006727 [Colletotrichum noveboracense]
MTPITCQVVNADHQGLPGMRVTLEYSGGYQFTSHMESVTDQRGITSGWAPRLGHTSSGFGPPGGYGYGGFSGWNATPRISLTFVTDRFFCIPPPWANIQACISTAVTGPASHHILLRFSRDKTSYQIMHTATPLTPPALEPSQVPAIDWNSDLYVDLTSSSPSSPFVDTPDTPSSPFIDALDTPSSLVLPSPVFTGFTA